MLKSEIDAPTTNITSLVLWLLFSIKKANQSKEMSTLLMNLTNYFVPGAIPKHGILPKISAFDLKRKYTIPFIKFLDLVNYYKISESTLLIYWNASDREPILFINSFFDGIKVKGGCLDRESK